MIKVGIIGLGTVAQLMHLPLLNSLYDKYKITAVCDVSPALTDLVLILMYLLFLITAGLTIWSLVRGATINSGNTGPNPTGIPSGKVTLCTWGTVIVSLVIGLIAGLGEEAYTTVSGVTTSAGMVTVVDMWLWAIYILSIIAIAAVVISMSGYLTKSATPKE